MKLRQIAPIGLIAATFALTACTGATSGQAKDNAAVKPASSPTAEAPAAPAAETSQAPAETAPKEEKPQVLTVAKLNGFRDEVLINQKGRTIYRFDKDSNKPAKSTCFDACAKTWEPVLVDSALQLKDPSIKQGLIGTIDRPEGQQVTLNGWPLYYFKDDLKLNEIAGQGSKGTWFAIAATGKKAKQTGGKTTTATTTSGGSAAY